MEATQLPGYLKSLLQRHNVTLAPDRAELIIYPKRPDEWLYPGAHIATGNDGEAYRHGIVTDTSGDMTIIHFWGENKKDAKIQTTTLNAFLAGHPNLIGKQSRPLYLIIYPDDNDEKRQSTVHNADILLTHADQYTYNLLSQNCEALACFCRTGRWESEQVERVTKILTRELHEKMQSWLPTSSMQNFSPSTNNSIQSEDSGHVVVKNVLGSFYRTIDNP